MSRAPTVLVIALLAGLALGSGAQQTAAGDAAEIRDTLRAGNASAAVRMATEVLERDGQHDPEVLWLRAAALEQLQDFQGAVADYRQLARDQPAPRLLLALGEAAFKASEMDISIEAFDEAEALDSRIGPHLWQRGIAHYYAGRFSDGAQQFEIHRTVNPHDVENSVWHYLCVAAEHGTARARSELLPTEGDGRVPMMEVLALFQGSGSVEEVQAATARASATPRAAIADFYGHLYLGLYHEAGDRHELAARHIAEAVSHRMTGNYMWHVARIHQALRKEAP